MQKIAGKSVEVINTLSPRLQWNESFVTADHLFCVYLAEDEEAIREHGRRGGFPVDGIHQIGTVIDGMMVARIDPRNRKMTSITRIAASSSVS